MIPVIINLTFIILITISLLLLEFKDYFISKILNNTFSKKYLIIFQIVIVLLLFGYPAIVFEGNDHQVVNEVLPDTIIQTNKRTIVEIGDTLIFYNGIHDTTFYKIEYYNMKDSLLNIEYSLTNNLDELEIEIFDTNE